MAIKGYSHSKRLFFKVFCVIDEVVGGGVSPCRVRLVRSMLLRLGMTTPSASAFSTDAYAPSGDVLMAPPRPDALGMLPRDLNETCRQVRQAIGKCLLQMEAINQSQEERCQRVRRELGRLNLMLAREDFRNRETARETCRILGAQLQETFQILDESAEAVRGVAYLNVSSLMDDWKLLELSLQHFASRLEEYEGESYSENIVYTPIAFSFPEQRPRLMTAVANWLSATFLNAPARLHRTGMKF